MKVLCVAEKNSISKEVSKILSNGHSTFENTSVKYVKNYKFNYFNHPLWGNCDVTMTSVAGHLTEHQPVEGNGWGQIEPEFLFKCQIERIVNLKMLKIAENISKLAVDADILMIWTDCDREGEYIGSEIVGAAKLTNDKFNLDSSFRATFSHLERNHILNAWKNPNRLDKNQIDAVECRMILDLRTGFSFTRFLTNSLRPLVSGAGAGAGAGAGTAGNTGPLISFGNCQFPTLGFVVDRFNRLKEFQKESFYLINLHIKHKKSLKKHKLTWERGHLFDKHAVVTIYQLCIHMDSDKAKVYSLDDKPTLNYAPLPLTTVELQKDCSRYFKFSAKETLSIAESLYQKGLVSYPRTETDKFPNSMDLKNFISKQCENPDWGQYATQLIDPTSNLFRNPRSGSHDDEAHPPIHPVGPIENITLNSKEKKIYEYIVRRFLASCSLDAKGVRRILRIKWGSEFFKTQGLTVTDKNYLEIYPYFKWESNKIEIPQVNIGEILTIVDCKVTKNDTKPPQGMTETELIALMDINGIGTDATIADHIEKIIERGYVSVIKGRQLSWGENLKLAQYSPRNGKSSGNVSGTSSGGFLVPTFLGYGLASGFSLIGLENISLTKPFLRKELEEDLTGICNGNKTKANVIREMISLYQEAYHITKGRIGVIKREVQKAKMEG
ncbi:DNA topoisomerase 3 [Martiniozyma asiatica (nom. inval.)]|nr:DNA topoisomerase 3 [Martiniozyma asiatica]